MRQFQPRGRDVFALSEGGPGRAGVGVAAAVADGEAERALRGGGQQGDIDRILHRGAGDGEGTIALNARSMHVGLLRVVIDGYGCRLRIGACIAASAAIADSERPDGNTCQRVARRLRSGRSLCRSIAKSCCLLVFIVLLVLCC